MTQSRVRLGVIAVAVALLAGACTPSSVTPVGSAASTGPILGPTSAPTAPPTPGPSQVSGAYQDGFDIGVEAYIYGLPVQIMNATFETMTSVDVSQGAFGPVNQLHHVRSPNGSGSTAVVAPGATSLSSIAWLDLGAEPQVLHIPKITGHHWVLALLDPWTENLRNFSDAAGTKPGDYVIVGPDAGEDLEIPAGAARVDVGANRIWVIGSTQLLGPDDIPAVNAIQDGYSLAPLSAYGTAYAPPEPANPRTTVARAAIPTGLAFLDTLGELLAAFPPPPEDANELAILAVGGIGPGRSPSTDPVLDPETARGLADGVAAGPARVREDLGRIYREHFPAHNGYLLGGFGAYGTDYALRAVIATVGLGAFRPEQAVYAMAWCDETGAALDGSGAYVLHVTELPASLQGWSLTAYDLKGALIANPLDRHAFTDRSPLARNADGSIDILVTATEPATGAERQNWLPVTEGEGFTLAWRFFAPDPASVAGLLDGSGTQPPKITPAGG